MIFACLLVILFVVVSELVGVMVFYPAFFNILDLEKGDKKCCLDAFLAN